MQNRLVARTLERDREAALGPEQTLDAARARGMARQPARLQAAELDATRGLAEDVPALWHAPTTTATDRQMIARLVLDRGSIRVDANNGHWGRLPLGRRGANPPRADPRCPALRAVARVRPDAEHDPHPALAGLFGCAGRAVRLRPSPNS